MPQVHEFFDVSTEGGRAYLIQGVSAAHAAHRVEIEFQERVTSVYVVKYHKIVLIGDEANATETTEDNRKTAESTGVEAIQCAEAAEEPCEGDEASTCDEDVPDKSD